MLTPVLQDATEGDAWRSSHSASAGSAFAGITAKETGIAPATANNSSSRREDVTASSSRHQSVAVLPSSPQRFNSSPRSVHSAIQGPCYREQLSLTKSLVTRPER